MNQPTIVLADGNEIPQIGFGVAGIRGAGATTKMVTAALKAGYKMIDNATIYGNEAEVGAALPPNSGIFLTSKVWPDMYGHDNVAKSFERSIEKLGVTVLDLFLLHWPAPAQDTYVESWQTLIELQNQGRIRSIGVSNFFPNQLERLKNETGIMPVINQIECHPFYQRNDERAFHTDHNIATQCWSPLGRSACLDDPLIIEIAKKHNHAPAQVILSWAMAQDLIVIPRSRSVARMQQNIDLGRITLDQNDMAQIALLDKGLDGKLSPDPADAA